jgi:hypothetical protein
MLALALVALTRGQKALLTLAFVLAHGKSSLGFGCQ